MPKTSSTFKEYANLPKYDADLYSDLSDLGWDYTAGRMSRSALEIYDTIMTRLGVLEDGEHWNEDCYKDHGCDH